MVLNRPDSQMIRASTFFCPNNKGIPVLLLISHFSLSFSLALIFALDLFPLQRKREKEEGGKVQIYPRVGEIKGEKEKRRKGERKAQPAKQTSISMAKREEGENGGRTFSFMCKGGRKGKKERKEGWNWEKEDEQEEDSLSRSRDENLTRTEYGGRTYASPPPN